MPLTEDKQAAEAAHEIAVAIDQLRAVYTATKILVGAIFEDSKFERILRLLDLDLQVGDPVDAQRKDVTWYEEPVDLRTTFEEIRANPDLLQIFTGFLITGMISDIGDRISRAHLYTKLQSPEMRFLRHVRNAVSHGNKFHFTGGEPLKEASFKGFTLTPSLHGTVIWDVLWPADLLELIDHIGLYLRSA